MKKKNKKRGKVRIKPIGAIIIILIITILAIILLPNKTNINLTKTYEKLLASDETDRLYRVWSRYECSAFLL